MGRGIDPACRPVLETLTIGNHWSTRSTLPAGTRSPMQLPSAVKSLAEACRDAGGTAWVVGGRVRDALMGLDSKDIDVEVHGIEGADLHELLATLGPVNEIGKSFGVFKVVIEKIPMDVSIPRRDSQVGPGHKDITVQGDPHMGIEEAARRRDLTINAIAYDPLTGEYADPFGGIHDIERGRLSAVDSMTFMEDPLRALRVVQFSARFGFGIHDSLMDLCRSARLTSLPAERIWGEFEKLLMRSPAPSIGWEAGMICGTLKQVLPEAATQPRAQIEAALDRAAELREDMDCPGRRTALMVAVMLHQLSPKEAEASLDRLKLFRLHDTPVRKRVLEAIQHWPALAEARTTPELLALADETEIFLVASVAWAISGRQEALRNIDTAFRLGVSHEPLPPLLTGKDLSQLGVSTGPQMGQLLSKLRSAQLAEEVSDKAQAIQWVKRTVQED